MKFQKNLIPFFENKEEPRTYQDIMTFEHVVIERSLRLYENILETIQMCTRKTCKNSTETENIH